MLSITLTPKKSDTNTPPHTQAHKQTHTQKTHKWCTEFFKKDSNCYINQKEEALLWNKV